MPAPKDAKKREEWKEKIRNSLRGRRCSPNTEFKKGNIPPPNANKFEPGNVHCKNRKGSKNSDEHRLNIKNGLSAFFASEEGVAYRKNLTERTKKQFADGMPEATRKKLSECTKKQLKGGMPEDTKRKIGEANKISMKGKNRGENNAHWNGGISCKYSSEWTKVLRESIRERDNYVCRMCGILQGDRALSVHHIDYNKDNCNSANLITLCGVCHNKTNLKREEWTKKLSGIIILE